MMRISSCHTQIPACIHIKLKLTLPEPFIAVRKICGGDKMEVLLKVPKEP